MKYIMSMSFFVGDRNLVWSNLGKKGNLLFCVIKLLEGWLFGIVLGSNFCFFESWLFFFVFVYFSFKWLGLLLVVLLGLYFFSLLYKR